VTKRGPIRARELFLSAEKKKRLHNKVRGGVGSACRYESPGVSLRER
jgi:hypothetical protein